MDFDFNVILVPITLFLGLIWLLDKLWFKRYKGESGSPAKLKVAEDKLRSHKKSLQEALDKHRIEYHSIDSFVLDESTNQTSTPAPVEVKRSYTAYREAKRDLNLAKVPSNKPKAPLLTRLAYDFFPVLFIVLVVRSFIIEPFNIPSSSMVPTLYTGDFIAVNKYAYGLRLPLTYNKIVDMGSPDRGDVAVFRYPENPKVYYIKRIVGLPGDTVTFDSGELSINGKTIPSEPVDYGVDSALTDQLYKPVKDSDGNWREGLSPSAAVERAQNEESVAQYFKEQLGKHTYFRRYLHDKSESSYTPRFSPVVTEKANGWQVQVPDGQYFVMGDNSDRSGDSRFWGFVPDENLAGKAVYIWMHKKSGLSFPTFERNGSID